MDVYEHVIMHQKVKTYDDRVVRVGDVEAPETEGESQ